MSLILQTLRSEVYTRDIFQISSQKRHSEEFFKEIIESGWRAIGIVLNSLLSTRVEFLAEINVALTDRKLILTRSVSFHFCSYFVICFILSLLLMIGFTFSSNYLV